MSQVSRRDLVQPDLSNEYREAYTYCAALAFGMVMLGKGSDVPADLVLLSRLRVLIHGEGHALANKHVRPTFDINLTSPAASIALGLMYLRTNRQDIADILTKSLGASLHHRFASSFCFSSWIGSYGVGGMLRGTPYGLLWLLLI